MPSYDATLDSIITSQQTSLLDSATAADDGDELHTITTTTTKTTKNKSKKKNKLHYRKTHQPRDVIISNLSLEYVGSGGAAKNRKLLDNATLKLLSGRVYVLIGRNGCGKSTLLRRIASGNIIGLSPELSTLYIPQEIFGNDDYDNDDNETEEDDDDGTITAFDLVKNYGKRKWDADTKRGREERLRELEDELEKCCASGDEDRMAEICDEMARLDDDSDNDGDDDDDDGGHDHSNDNNNNDEESNRIHEALDYFDISSSERHAPLSSLSGGVRKKILLSCAIYHNPDVLMLDEPTNHLDLAGIIRLRAMISNFYDAKNKIVLLVSHDLDLIETVATDIIHFYELSLTYYVGSYRDFLGYKNQKDLCKTRQNEALQKQRKDMIQTIDNLKKKSGGKRGDKKKKKAIDCRVKKLERHGVEKDEHGHRWVQHKSETGVREGAINGINASIRNKLSHTQLLKRSETNIAPIPDKAVQFKFQNTPNTWGHDEPLIMAADVSYVHPPRRTPPPSSSSSPSTTTDRLLFEGVDLCLREKSLTCIMGSNASGKSTLLKILASLTPPTSGTIRHAANITIGYFSQHVADDLLHKFSSDTTTALSLLRDAAPLSSSEHDLRAELTAFGLPSTRILTPLRHLSGGERTRLCLARLMLQRPDVLIFDEPTNHLDVESVAAFVYGVKEWNGTVVMVTHDVSVIRTLGESVDIWVVVEGERRVRRVEGGLDVYVRSLEGVEG